jgi:hypothetical protein
MIHSGQCNDEHDGYNCTKIYGHQSPHGTFRLGIGSINWERED